MIKKRIIYLKNEFITYITRSYKKKFYLLIIYVLLSFYLHITYAIKAKLYNILKDAISSWMRQV